MNYFYRLFFFSVFIDQETILNWFGIPSSANLNSNDYQNYFFSNSIEINTKTSNAISIQTLKLIFEELWNKIQNGLTLGDIESILFVIVFIRFIFFVFKYNLKTSFYITCIGICAGYLWYRHLIDLILMYRNTLIKLPFVSKLGASAIELRTFHRKMALTDLKLGENVHWYNLGQLIYYSFTKGIVKVDPETGLRYYIDPISMIIANLKEETQLKILPYYYKLYNNIIPRIFNSLSKFWNQLSGIAAYAMITRVGKRYCPYLVRWHWTFLLIIGLLEEIFMFLVFRIYYFQTYVLIPKAVAVSENYTSVNSNIILQINFLNVILAVIVLTHLAFVILGLFHAICGQYFYFPFFVENTELHIGPRPKNSIYSGGHTAWQDYKKKAWKNVFPRFWYGWFGRGTKKD